jgi:hypothetical protein
MSGADMTLKAAMDIEVIDRRSVFLSNLGPPDTFSKAVDEIDGTPVVSEQWSYIEMGVRLDLVDGEIAYVVPIETTPEDAALYPRFYDPMEFDLPMDKDEALKILEGQELTQLDLADADIEDGLMVLGDQIMLGFAEDQLVYVETYARTPDREGQLQELFIDVGSDEVALVASLSEERSAMLADEITSSDASARDLQDRAALDAFLPPPARYVVGFFRLFRAHSRRNRVYREANQLQQDYADYLDKLNRKATVLAGTCQLANTDRQSNVATLVKVREILDIERQFVEIYSEDSKKKARNRFIRRARSEIISALSTSGFGTRVVQKIKSSANIDQTLIEIQGVLDGALDPGDIHKKITERLDKLGILGQVIGGTVGARFRKLIVDAQQKIPVAGDLQKAAGEMQKLIYDTQDTIEEIEEALEDDTGILTPAHLVGAIDDLKEVLSDPAMDAMARALAKELEPGIARNQAISDGKLDPEELETMYERVRAHMLRERNEALREKAREACGRPAGQEFRSYVGSNTAPKQLARASDEESGFTAHLGPDGAPLAVCQVIPMDFEALADDVLSDLDSGNLVNPASIAVCRTTNDVDGDGWEATEFGGEDCDDSDDDRFPGNIEICDGVDNDCNGKRDDGISTDADGDGHYSKSSCASPADDCNDNDASIHPGATDIESDGIDQDCDGKDNVPEYKRYYVFKRSGTGYRKKWGGYAERREGYDYFYHYILPSQVSDVMSDSAAFAQFTQNACSGTYPPTCPCATYPDIWQSGKIELMGGFDTYEEMDPYRCDTYQFDPWNIICTQWEYETDPKYWNNINAICGY